MSAKSYNRGHEIIYIDGKWIYIDNSESIKNKERSCSRCGKFPTPEGYDACLGYIKGAYSACCGHGVSKPYIKYLDISKK